MADWRRSRSSGRSGGASWTPAGGPGGEDDCVRSPASRLNPSSQPIRCRTCGSSRRQSRSCQLKYRNPCGNGRHSTLTSLKAGDVPARRSAACRTRRSTGRTAGGQARRPAAVADCPASPDLCNKAHVTILTSGLVTQSPTRPYRCHGIWRQGNLRRLVRRPLAPHARKRLPGWTKGAVLQLSSCGRKAVLTVANRLAGVNRGWPRCTARRTISIEIDPG